MNSQTCKNKAFPSIDVIIPVFNCEDYVLDAIRSVEQQTYIPNKIIIIDDGSTDCTSEKVLQYKSKIPIIHFKKENDGPNSARNIGIKNCTSDYVAFLDADDEWNENKLKKQIKVFEKTNLKNLGVVYCKYTIINEKGYLKENQTIEFDPTLRGKVYKKLLNGRPVASSASGVLIKRKCFDKVGLFDESLLACDDWDMWIRLAEHYEFDYADEELVKIRRHQKSVQNNGFYIFINELIFYNKWAEKINDTDSKCFADRISSRTIERLRKLEFMETVKYINIANRNLTAATKKKLFSSTFSSLKLYIFVKVIMIAINKIKKIFVIINFSKTL